MSNRIRLRPRRKAALKGLAAFIAIGLAFTGCADEEPGAPAPGGIDPVDVLPVAPGPDVDAQRWLVELDAPPIIRGGARARILDQHRTFLAEAARVGVRLEPTYRITRVWNGLSVRIATVDVWKLIALPGVRRVFPVIPIAPPRSADPGTGPKPDLATSIGMIGADIAHNTLGLTGQGVRVGVIDTGIDYNHPDLGGCFGAGCRVAFGTDLVGDAFDAGVSGSVTVPDNDPDDCAGHGTHVSGIIGASGTVTGVAPKVTFGAYRVFGCAGSTRSDIMIVAMDDAFGDDMRVINMSIGSAFTWPEYPTGAAVTNLVNAGVVVATSIGNSGTNGLYAAGAPGVGVDSIGVASIDNIAVRQPAVQISPTTAMTGNGLIGYAAATGAPAPPTSGSPLPLARTGTVATTNDACNPLPAGSLTGQIVLIRRGTCGFFVKATNAQTAGAVGVILYNNAPGFITPTVAGTPPITIPVVAITAADGAQINLQLDAGATTVAWTNLLASTPNPTGGLISSFSSWGPTAELTFKPDLAAPGGSIFSTYPLELGGYASLSGTSMASPHVAGAAALILEARPGVSPRDVQALLENTAIPAPNAPAAPPAATQRQGAGMIHVDVAATTTLMVTPASLALGESAAGPQTRTLTIHNLSTTDPVTVDLTHLAAVSVTGTTWAPASSTTLAATVAFSQPQLTIAAGASQTVDVTITANAAIANGNLYGGYLVFTPGNGKPAVSVPYQGFGGDYQAVKILTPNAQGFPWLARPNGASYTNQPAGGTFTLAGTDVPVVVFHLDHYARKLVIDVADTSGKPIGNWVTQEFLSHASTQAEIVAFRWNGVVTADKQQVVVPNGNYVFKLKVLKPLGDEANPADSETWTSPVVTLDHP